MLIYQRTWQELDETVKQLNEKNMQKDVLEQLHEKIFQEWKEAEEQKSKAALELLGQKQKLCKLEKERDRARMLEGKELPAAEGGYTAATGSSSFRSSSPSVEPEVEEGMLTPSRGSPLVERESDRWSADLEGEMEKLLPLAGPSIWMGRRTTGHSDGAHKRRK